MTAKEILDSAKETYPVLLGMDKEAEKVILNAMDNFMKTKLSEYTDFLLKEGYCDTDVYCEPPTAIDQFLNSKLR